MRRKPPKTRLTKAEKDALKRKDKGAKFLREFTLAPDAKWPGER